MRDRKRQSDDGGTGIAGSRVAAAGKGSRAAARYGDVPPPGPGPQQSSPSPGASSSVAPPDDAWLRELIEGGAAAEKQRLPDAKLERACRLNPFWLRKHGVKTTAYGFSDASPSDERFAYHIAALQQEAGLTIDGIAGPKTARAFGVVAAEEPDSAEEPSPPASQPASPRSKEPSLPQPAHPQPARPRPARPRPAPPRPVKAGSTGSRVAGDRDPALGLLIKSLKVPAALNAWSELEEIRAIVASKAGERGTYDNAEAIGSWRDDVVARIRALRRQVAALDEHALPEDSTRGVVITGLYRGIQQVTPSYYQSHNMDLLEPPGASNTRTCNVTSIAMALESLGKTSADYDPSMRESVMDVARSYHHIIAKADDTVGNAKRAADFSQLAGLRLPDFLQLAAVAEKLGPAGGNNKAAKQAQKQAYDAIVGSHHFLVRLARRFGVSCTRQTLRITDAKGNEQKRGSAVKAFGKEKVASGKHYRRRDQIDLLVDRRNRMEAAKQQLDAATGSERKRAERRHAKAKASYESSLRGNRKHLKDSALRGVSVAAYREAVLSQVAPKLDEGAAVFSNLANHFVRVQAIYDDYVIVDDPGTKGRADRKVLWDEARALGYFAYWFPLDT